MKITKKQLRKNIRSLLLELSLTTGVYENTGNSVIQHLNNAFNTAGISGFNEFIGRSLPARNAPLSIDLSRAGLTGAPTITSQNPAPAGQVHVGSLGITSSGTRRRRDASRMGPTVSRVAAATGLSSITADDILKADAATILNANDATVYRYVGTNSNVITSIGPGKTDGDAGEHLVGNWCTEISGWGDRWDNMNGKEYKQSFIPNTGNLFGMSETSYPAFDCMVWTGGDLIDKFSFDPSTRIVNIDAIFVSAKYTASTAGGVIQTLRHEFHPNNFAAGILAFVLGYCARKLPNTNPFKQAIVNQEQSQRVPGVNAPGYDLDNNNALTSGIKLLADANIRGIQIRGYGAITMSLVNYLTGAENKEALQTLPTLICATSQLTAGTENTPLWYFLSSQIRFFV